MTLADAPARVSRAVPRIVRCVEAEPRLFARALAWRLLLPVLKTAVPVKVLAGWMDRSHRLLPAAVAAARVAAVERLLAEGGRLIVSSNCLERSLLAYRLLSETGVEVSLVMGMRRDGATVAGHAWVELNRRPFADATAARYDPIVRFEPRKTGHGQHGQHG